jgi:archaellum component FlaD/FlaE
MTDEDKKKIVSEPPPPTDEIDGEWGDDDQTLIRDVPEGVSKSQPAPPAAAVAETAVAPISVPAKAAEASTPPEMKAAAPVTGEDDEEEDEEDEEDEDEEDEAASDNEDDEEEDDEEEDEEDDQPAPPPGAAAPAAADWLPDWAPYAVLALLVSSSIVFGLGLLGGPGASAEDGEKAAEPAASAAKKPIKVSPHP